MIRILVIPDSSKSFSEGAIHVGGWNIENEDAYSRMYLMPWQSTINSVWIHLLKSFRIILLILFFYGTNGEKIKVTYEREYGSGNYMTAFEGVINSLERRYKETQSDGMKQYYEEFMSSNPCPECKGARLKKESLAVTVGDKNISEIVSYSQFQMQRNSLTTLHLSDRHKLIANQIFKEINARIGFLVDVGLDYLITFQSSRTLSGGEAQRIRLATQIGSGLMGVLYILDEPSIGLHQRDNERLIKDLKRLRDLGNTLIVVEHDEDTMYEADYIIDMGPGAGIHGGDVVCEGNNR